MSARPPEFVEPAYEQRSLGDVVPAVARALGVPVQSDLAPRFGLHLPDAPSYVVFLIDGLGHRLLDRHRQVAPFLASLMGEPGTAGVPSTTATSLASLGTALTPGVHGLVGYTARIPGTERLLNHLSWDRSVDPEQWQPHPTAFSQLAAAGISVASVNKREFARSGLTRAAHRGAEYVGADRVGERVAAVQTAAGRQPSLTYVYDSDLDWTGHRHGVASTAWLQQLAAIDAEAEALREALPAATRLVVVADHGMVDATDQSRIDLDEVPGMRDGLALIGGEARFRQLYCRPGAVTDVVDTWRGLLADRADVLTREQAVARGWFGRVTPEVLPRLGDVLVACRADTVVLSSVDFRQETSLVGFHGSLTADEMLIPILVA